MMKRDTKPERRYFEHDMNDIMFHHRFFSLGKGEDMNTPVLQSQVILSVGAHS